MENNFSTKSSVNAGIAGYASPILLTIALLGLSLALLLIALPGVAGQLHFHEREQATMALPVELSMTTADQHLQIAESFNAALEQTAAQNAAQQDTQTAAR